MNNRTKSEVKCITWATRWYITGAWEYALSTWGAARIKYCNGEPAVVKNPGNYPGMCKHLVAVAKLAVERAD